jgi:hypothetical protein
MIIFVFQDMEFDETLNDDGMPIGQKGDDDKVG